MNRTKEEQAAYELARGINDLVREEKAKSLKNGVILGVLASMLYPTVKKWADRKIAVFRAERGMKK